MRGSFTKGLLLGSLIGASIGVMKNADMMRPRNRRRMMRAGRNMFRKTSNAIGDVVDLFR
ncbi:MAG: YtxH domain-containing protein [Bacillota bacterium]|nr:YtxH domain-containing protein [Bacillota bacterium]